MKRILVRGPPSLVGLPTLLINHYGTNRLLAMPAEVLPCPVELQALMTEIGAHDIVPPASSPAEGYHEVLHVVAPGAPIPERTTMGPSNILRALDIGRVPARTAWESIRPILNRLYRLSIPVFPNQEVSR